MFFADFAGNSGFFRSRLSPEAFFLPQEPIFNRAIISLRSPHLSRIPVFDAQWITT
jgi:hypothetical protein